MLDELSLQLFPFCSLRLDDTDVAALQDPHVSVLRSEDGLWELEQVSVDGVGTKML